MRYLGKEIGLELDSKRVDLRSLGRREGSALYGKRTGSRTVKGAGSLLRTLCQEEALLYVVEGLGGRLLLIKIASVMYP